MHEESNWYIPKRVIYQKLTGDISFDDAIQLGAINLAYLDEGDPPVHFIFDTSEIGSTPLRLNIATDASQWVKHENFGWAVVVGISGFSKFILNVIQNTLGFRMGTANNLDDAVEWLKGNDETLRTLQY